EEHQDHDAAEFQPLHVVLHFRRSTQTFRCCNVRRAHLTLRLLGPTSLVASCWSAQQAARTAIQLSSAMRPIICPPKVWLAPGRRRFTAANSARCHTSLGWR